MTNRTTLRGLLTALLVLATAACAESEAGDGTAADRTQGTRAATGAGALLQQQTETGESSIRRGDATDLLGQAPARDSVDINELGFDRGSEDAPVRILEFSDFGCGYCRQFHLETLALIEEEYIDPGSVLWKQIPFVMGNWPNSVPASLGAECALRQNAFAGMSHGLYERQSDWKGASTDEADAVVRDIASSLDMDMAAWDACMENDEELQRVQIHTQLARQVGVRSTPTFFIVGYSPVQGALPIELFRQVIDTVLVLEGQDGG